MHVAWSCMTRTCIGLASCIHCPRMLCLGCVCPKMLINAGWRHLCICLAGAAGFPPHAYNMRINTITACVVVQNTCTTPSPRPPNHPSHHKMSGQKNIKQAQSQPSPAMGRRSCPPPAPCRAGGPGGSGCGCGGCRTTPKKPAAE